MVVREHVQAFELDGREPAPRAALSDDVLGAGGRCATLTGDDGAGRLIERVRARHGTFGEDVLVAEGFVDLRDAFGAFEVLPLLEVGFVHAEFLWDVFERLEIAKRHAHVVCRVRLGGPKHAVNHHTGGGKRRQRLLFLC